MKFGVKKIISKKVSKQILPSICVPKSIFITSPYCKTVSSPQLGV